MKSSSALIPLRLYLFPILIGILAWGVANTVLELIYHEYGAPNFNLILLLSYSLLALIAFLALRSSLRYKKRIPSGSMFSGLGAVQHSVIFLVLFAAFIFGVYFLLMSFAAPPPTLTP